MENEDRKSPDEWLEVVKKEESRAEKGRLKIFLGLAAGVGKTYAMLEEANKLNSYGVNIAVGIVETHGRQETAALLKGLREIPLKTLSYKGKEFKEFAVDKVIEVHPSIVLVDELAHNNVPGSKHIKRWQDVLEILDQGIDVFTTLNIQHIESLNDIIRTITDISVHETVPDHVIDLASSIQVVDLTPDELLERLTEGKVYFDEQSKMASLHFFKKEKLTALRELALRYAADKVDRDLRGMAVQEEKMTDWKPREKLLVAISSSPHSQKLIRVARRLAAARDATWIAVHIDDGSKLDSSKMDQLARNFALANDLGGEVITIGDSSINNGIRRIVRQRGITQIIVGRPFKPFFARFFKGFSLIDQLTTSCPDTDIHIIHEEKELSSQGAKFFVVFSKKWRILLIITLIGIISWFATSWISYTVVGAIFSSVILFLILIAREKEHKTILEKSEESAHTLYEVAHQIATAPSITQILKLIKERLERLLDGTVEFAIKDMDGVIQWDKLSLLTNEKEQAAALWSFNSGKEAGWSTDTLPSAENLYIPLQGYHEIVGLLIYKSENKQPLRSEEKNLIYTISRQLSYYLERGINREKLYQHENLVQMQKIYKAILDRISKVSRWPINRAISATNALKHRLQAKHYPEIQELESSCELISKNLTDITTIAELSEGMVPLQKTKCLIHELIEECVLAATSLLKEHSLKVTVEQNLPPIYIDSYLIQILLNNLIFSAIDYSDPQTPIEIDVKRVDERILITVISKGKTIPEEQLENIFDQFIRLKQEPLPLFGLGLALSKTIADLHQGILKVENSDQGVKYSLSLPL